MCKDSYTRDQRLQKPKSSGYSKEPSRRKASMLGARFGEYLSSCYLVRYPYSDFLVPPTTFLINTGSSCKLQEPLVFPRSFLVMGNFFNPNTHGAQWANTQQILAPEAPPLKTQLVLPALYAFLLAQLTDYITNFWRNSELFQKKGTLFKLKY